MPLRKLAALGAASCLLAAPAAASAAEVRSVPEQGYVVTLRDTARSTPAQAADRARGHGGEVTAMYERALPGFAARLSPEALSAVRADPNVATVEVDGTARIAATQSPTPSWGLDRVDQRTRTLDKAFSYIATGPGVRVYVVDTGINAAHEDFAGGRATSGWDFIENDAVAQDCQGHGTHVAGTAAGVKHGVAKGASVVAVRVLDCTGSGPDSGVISALDWIVANHPGGPGVVNLSLVADQATTAMDAAVNGVIANGLSVSAAAGNGVLRGQDACRYSPARVPDALTTSATDTNDRKLSSANHGSCVDWFAPGGSIVSASHSSTTGTATKSGTSMAAPHTAGVAALFLETTPAATPAEVREALYAETTKGVVGSSSSANNHLLFTQY